MTTAVKVIPTYDRNDYDTVIDAILNDLRVQKFKNVADRIAFISRRFLHKPYLAGALGEGESGRFDQNPLYRTDAFDCVTFVNTVLALSRSNDKKMFQKNIITINYYDSIPQYGKRFHFVSADWNVQNEKKKFIKNITDTIKNVSGHLIYETAKTLIDRPNWFRHRSFYDIKLLKPVADGKARRLLEELRAFSSQMEEEINRLPYLPLRVLFKNDKPNDEIFSQIPHGSIIEIVRPNWNLHDKIGTNLNVSHLGFVLRIKSELIFRHASLLEKRVVDVPLIDYLKNCLSIPTIKGVHVLRCEETL